MMKMRYILMKLEKIFKPEKRRLILFLIIMGVVLILQYSINPTNSSLRTSMLEKITSNFFPYNYLLGRFYGCGNVPFVETCFDWKGLKPYGGSDITLLHFSIIFGLFLITYYLLSCLLVYVYDNIRKK